MKSLVNHIKKIIDSFSHLRIRTKINIFYIIILFISLITSYTVYDALNYKILEKEISSTSIQTLDALDKNLEFILDDVAQFSDLLFFDKSVQGALRNVNSQGIDVLTQRTLNGYLANMLQSSKYISSVYLFDNYNNKYAMGKQMLKRVKLKDITEADWYYDVNSLQGSLMWVEKGGGLLSYNDEENFISLVRVINDLNTLKKIAVLMVNVDESTIMEGFNEVGKKNNSQFFIMNDQGDYVINPPNRDKLNGAEYFIKSQLKEKQGFVINDVDGKKAIISFITSRYNNWKIVGIMPITQISSQIRLYKYIAFLIIIINSIFITMGTIFLTNLITKPLMEMQRYMELAQNGDFQTMPMEGDREDEIIQLKKGFNVMVTEIKKLINQVKKEQKIIRKNELSLIQAQVNPHFLYNTLDAISALSIMGDSNSAYKMAQALGEFYRTSLSSGREVITVEEEINCIKNYLTILDIRYKGKFEVCIDVDDDILNQRILKLILQPIVENAVHHGIRNKRGKGKVEVIGYRDRDNLIFKIKDDGIGMDRETVKSILSKNLSSNKNGFGIYSSMERISIFYNVERPINIISNINEGTEIIISIPIIREENNG